MFVFKQLFTFIKVWCSIDKLKCLPSPKHGPLEEALGLSPVVSLTNVLHPWYLGMYPLSTVSML